MNIKKLHFFSGITLTLFIGAHLFNHFMSIFGIDQHLQVMESLRAVYRNPIIEIFLLLVVLLQVFSGIKLLRTNWKASTTFYQRLQLYSGLYLSFFLIFHVGAVMAGRFVFDLDTNTYFGIAGLNTFPFNLFFLPYYSLAILSFWGHVAAIHQQKMKGKLMGLNSSQQANLILGIGVLTLGITLYGLTNGFSGAAFPEAYDVIVGG